MKFRAGEMEWVGVFFFFFLPEDHELSLFHIRRGKSLSVVDCLVISGFVVSAGLAGDSL